MYTNAVPLLLLMLLPVMICASGGNQQIDEGSRQKVLADLQERFIGLEEAATQASSSLHEADTREQVELLRHLNFVPPAIDFGKWSVGQTVTQIVTLFNQHTNRTVHLNSVAGPSPVFYSSFFGAREVPPQGNTTFSVVFLPRQLGAISTGLLIQTSFGRTEFSVRGEGSECPYRLKPLVGIKAPMNATLTPEIHMYNPHERPLQILEVYSSGGEFQLELPSGAAEGPQNLWEIPPHSLKPVIRISFHGRTAGNHSAYIRIKIAEQSPDGPDGLPLEHLSENILVIPVEFEILPRHGAYARNPLADFGRLVTDQHTDALHFKLDMQNQEKQQLIGTYLRDIPGLSYNPHNASIVLDPKLFEESASINDLLVVGSEGDEDQQFTVLIRAEIFKGGLGYDRNATIFVTGSSFDETPLQTRRTLVVRNNFAFPLVLYNVSLSEPIDAAQLELSLMEQELLLQPGESVELLHLHLLDEKATFNSTLRIESNVTIFELPVVACTGRLHVSAQPFSINLSPDNEYGLELDLGTVPFAQMSRDGYIVLRNDNPMPIKINNWYFEPPKHVFFTAVFLGCMPTGSNYTPPVLPTPTSTPSVNILSEYCRQLEQGESAAFSVSIKTYVTEESVGTLKVWSNHELIRTTVRFKASVGQLDIEQDQLQFKSCFPGKICSAVLSIRSSFMHPVHVKSVQFSRPGLRFKDFNAKGTTIGAQTLTKVGRIYFEPAALCGDTCYIRRSFNDRAFFPTQMTPAQQGNNNLLYDGVEVRQRTELFRQFKRQLKFMSLTLHSEELPPLELDFSIAIEWPKLVQHQPLPPTPAIEVGQVQRQWITLSNPTAQPLLLDYFLSDPLYARRTQLSLPLEVIDVSSSSCYLTDKDVFSLPDAPGIGGPLLLPGGATLTIPVQFSAQQPDKYCTLLHVRSNLTLYEAVWLTARAVQSQFRFGNRRPGSSTPLLFELDAQQFERCDGTIKPDEGQGKKDLGATHSVVTTRTFVARNAGVLPIMVRGFRVGRRPCEGYGFWVIDCHAFELRENETRRIEISFTTDFTASRVQRTLTLLTNLSYDINYQLVAQLPAESVERCAATLPRPPWESSLRNAAVVVLLASFCLVLLAAIIDARAIMAHQHAYDAARYKDSVQPPFNLRNIVKMQVAEEAAAAAAAAASAAALKAEQQQKLRNGQLKELRRRQNAAEKQQQQQQHQTSSNNNTRKTKSWTPWSMDIATPAPAAATPPQPPKPSNSPKPVKKQSPVAATPPPATVRAPKKTKQTTPPTGATSKPRMESTPPAETQEKRTPSQPSQPSQAPVKPSPPPAATQENVSPRPAAKANVVETPKERVLKEQNGSAKKLGKTPGRERRKEQKTNGLGGSGGKKSVERKQRNKQLNFDEMPEAVTGQGASPVITPEADTMITSPWQTSSRVSFRDVLQTNPLPAVDNGLNWNPAGSDLASSQLGPIGSRKSYPPQTVSSPWDPLLSSEAPAAPVTVSSNSLNNFSLFDISTEQPALGMGQLELPTLNDFAYEHEQPQTQWERSNFILEQQQLVQLEQQRKQQQQREQQREQQQEQQKTLQEKLLLLSQMESNNWPMNQATPTTTWSPLGYQAWPQTGVTAAGAVVAAAAAASVRNSPVHTISPGVIRPPPGLETANFMNNNNCPLPAVGDAVAPLQVNHNSNNHIDHTHNATTQQQQQQQVDDERRMSLGMSTMPTQYDPFTSPSSIWSDNWRQRNNHMN